MATEFEQELAEFRERHEQLRVRLSETINELNDVTKAAEEARHSTLSEAETSYEQQVREAREACDQLVSEAQAIYKDTLVSAQKKYEETMEELNPELLNVLPLNDDIDKQPPTRRAAYSDRAAVIMAKLAMLAYQNFETAEQFEEILRLKLAQGGLQLVGTFDCDCGTEGYVCQNDEYAVLVFRGTNDKLDWKINRDSKRVVIKDNALRIRAHRGFLEAYLEAEPKILELLNQVPDAPLYITGHSLGGALAVVASASLPMEIEVFNDQIAAVYTFGSPRVGGGDFNRLVKAPHYRVYNPGDMVPSVPPYWMSFRHTGDVRYITHTNRPPKKVAPWHGVITLTLWSLWGYVRRKGFIGVSAHDIKSYVLKLDKIAKFRNRDKVRETFPGAFGPSRIVHDIEGSMAKARHKASLEATAYAMNDESVSELADEIDGADDLQSVVEDETPEISQETDSDKLT